MYWLYKNERLFKRFCENPAFICLSKQCGATRWTYHMVRWTSREVWWAMFKAKEEVKHGFRIN